MEGPEPLAVHEKVVPLTLLERLILLAVPLHILWEVGLNDTLGIGFTVTVTVIALPAQPPAVGVTVYVTVASLVPVLISV